eukprot:5739995-Pyramimonas_sp.AAC.1
MVRRRPSGVWPREAFQGPLKSSDIYSEEPRRADSPSGPSSRTTSLSCRARWSLGGRSTSSQITFGKF